MSFIEVDLGLKKDALLSSDGSSLEALLKGESLDKRTSADPRATDEDSNVSDYAGGLNPATRIRKVLVFTGSDLHDDARGFPLISHVLLHRESLSQKTSWMTWTMKTMRRTHLKEEAKGRGR